MQTNQNENLEEQVQTIIADAIQVPIDQVPPDLSFGDLPQWDSMGHMEVMMHLEQQFGIEINADTIASLISIPEICAYLKENSHV
jgi:acyl carrier protein